MQPRIYTYKITFEEVPYYYYGSKKEKKYNEEYWGSPKTNRWCWELYTPKKQILEIFDYTDEGYEECRKVENRLIKPFLDDTCCLNERCGGHYSLEVCRKVGERSKELGKGIHSLTFEERSELGKRNAKKSKELELGFYKMTFEERSELGKRNAKKSKELGIGIFALTKDELSETSKKVAYQKWQCTITGFIANAGNLAQYQRRRGIDTTNRIRIQ